MEQLPSFAVVAVESWFLLHPQLSRCHWKTWLDVLSPTSAASANTCSSEPQKLGVSRE